MLFTHDIFLSTLTVNRNRERKLSCLTSASVESLTLSVDAYLPEEHSYQILSRFCFKWQNLRLCWRGRRTKNKNPIQSNPYCNIQSVARRRRRTRWVAMWDRFLIENVEKLTFIISFFAIFPVTRMFQAELSFVMCPVWRVAASWRWLPGSWKSVDTGAVRTQRPT